ncbi:hypothetical protein C6568_02925 [Melaminivora suipulveris]|uniref:J domain-containing protein n=1 Tax=Melaminivora suipulveris TaxID=2109913 RepID=A0A2R3Q981_9BURK|nr:J domain-containing protein [Melaminivora suipulveris]AVO48319.1 hypothetical protein C6568_02925 [Melaminivora suipulveris]
MGAEADALYTHYDNLKIARDAPPEVVRAAYRVLAQKYHPDKWADGGYATDVMQAINASYAVLMDAQERAAHDAWIREQERRQALRRSPGAGADEPQSAAAPTAPSCWPSPEAPEPAARAGARAGAGAAAPLPAGTAARAPSFAERAAQAERARAAAAPPHDDPRAHAAPHAAAWAGAAGKAPAPARPRRPRSRISLFWAFAGIATVAAAVTELPQQEGAQPGVLSGLLTRLRGSPAASPAALSAGRAPDAALPAQAADGAAPLSRAARDAQLQQIAASHPDARQIVASQDFVRWTQRAGARRQTEAARILHSGTAEEVIALLSEYKRQAGRR